MQCPIDDLEHWKYIYIYIHERGNWAALFGPSTSRTPSAATLLRCLSGEVGLVELQRFACFLELINEILTLHL